MKAEKLPSGNYRAIAYLGTDAEGKRIRKSFTHTNKRQAIALASHYELTHKIGDSRGSFSACMRRFLDEKRKTLSPSTYSDYLSRSRALLSSYSAFCRLDVNIITADDLSALVRDMATVQAPRHKLHHKHRAMSSKTIKNYFGLIRAVFNYAGVTMPHVDLPKKEIFDIYVPTDAEVHTLINYVRGTDMFVPVLLAAFGPLRRGEICALEYPTDFSKNVVHVRQAVAKTADHDFIRKSPKTPGSDRRIELPDFVIKAIRQQGYVTNLNPNQITSNFPRILRRAGLPAFRFHDLRHWCISTLHAQGIPDQYIMARSGHSTDDILKKVYRHTLADQDRIMAARALKHFQNFRV